MSKTDPENPRIFATQKQFAFSYWCLAIPHEVVNGMDMLDLENPKLKSDFEAWWDQNEIDGWSSVKTNSLRGLAAAAWCRSLELAQLPDPGSFNSFFARDVDVSRAMDTPDPDPACVETWKRQAQQAPKCPHGYDWECPHTGLPSATLQTLRKDA